MSSETTIVITVPGGKRVSVEKDLEFGVVADIATRHDVQWLALVGAPLRVPGGALLDLYRACCAAVGVEAPTPLTVRTVFDAVEAVPDDMPAYYEDGSPKGEQPETT